MAETQSDEAKTQTLIRINEQYGHIVDESEIRALMLKTHNSELSDEELEAVVGGKSDPSEGVNKSGDTLWLL